MNNADAVRTRVAVVEDDDELREEILLPLLRREGFEAIGMPSALSLYRDLVATPFDLILLDVGLPDDDGFAIARHLRKAASKVGLVMLTGYASAPSRLRGLEAGVDAYLTKPIDSAELVATLRNLERRLDSRDAALPRIGWKLDELGWKILLPDGRSIELSLPERRLMAQLAATPREPVTREALMAVLAEDADDFDPHRLEMLIHRLRKKCLQATGQELPVRTVRGVGYVLAW
ncbi:response regulator transcription factor [Luteimonas terrae]|uniref:DNA-binding response OmpR family regulator n=1 Tax=Luteimonas terrae TaxID=1530191 RepID=A0ABU1XSQ0_9GAMM|nr:response regulator transcription factor [Luteimonas terrae]MDR7191787.1 DNA-binding response OmpR family regulator [Luteimonas terrae]